MDAPPARSGRRPGWPRPLQRITSGRLLRSAGVRFAIVYALVFGLSACAVAVSLWYATVGLLQRQVEITIHNDATALNDHYQTGGLPSLIEAIQDRLAADAEGQNLYLLLDPLGNRIIGNVDQWPAGLGTAGGSLEVKVMHGRMQYLAVVRGYALSAGGQLLVGRDIRARAQLRDVLRNGLLWALALMIVLGLIGAMLIRSLFRRMIRDISVTTRAIARGDLSRRVPKSAGGNEFDELAEIINDMLDRITRLMDGVRQVSNAIAHDLRTPITRARTRLEDASLHACTNEELRSAVDRATLDLDDIVGLFEALLRIAEIEAGSRRAAFAEIDIAPLIADVHELYHVVAEERGLLLDTSIDAVLPLLGDRQLIQQAVANLLDNALKFSPTGGTIGLTARLRATMLEIAVTDRGPGIAETDRERATERFFRAESARSTSGSGLGLALVAAVAQLHNGALRLEDNNPGLRAVIALPTRLDGGGAA